MAEGCRPNQRLEFGQARATRCFHGPAGLAGLVYCPLYGPAGLAGLAYCPLYGPAGLAGLAYCPLYGLAGQRDGLLSGGQEHWPSRRGTRAPSSADPSGNLHRWKARGVMTTQHCPCRPFLAHTAALLPGPNPAPAMKGLAVRASLLGSLAATECK